MKNRKVLAFVLALAMVITLIPGAAFAASTTTVDSPKVVTTDTEMPVVRLMLKMGEGGAVDNLQTFKLTLENAEWAMGASKSSIVIPTTTNGAYGINATSVASIQMGLAAVEGTSTTIGGVTINAITSSTAEISLDTGTELQKDEVIFLYLCLVSGEEPGEVRVIVDGLDSDFSNSSSVVGIIGSGNTTATVNGTLPSAWRTSGLTAASIEIRENAVNAVPNSNTPQTLRLTLPSGMVWSNIISSGALGVVTLNSSSSYNGGNSGLDTRDLWITVVPSTANDAVRDAIWLTPVVDITKNAKLGDITVTIRNVTSGANASNRISNASGLIVGHYIEESVKVYTDKEADLPELVAGREDDTYEVVVYVEEVVSTALARDRYIDFEFPDYVQIPSGQSIDSYRLLGGSQVGAFEPDEGDAADDTSSFEFRLPSDIGGSKDKFKFEIPVTIEPDTPTGDLVVTVKGAKAGLPDTELVVGKILAPITAEVGVTDIRAGIQKQSLKDIVIKENFAGALLDRDGGNTATIRIAMSSDLTQNSMAKFKDATATVISGDGEIGKVSIPSNGIIYIEVKSQSVKEPMEIKISDVVLTVDRTPAEGPYGVGIGGTALVTNNLHSMNYRDDDFTDDTVSTTYVNVITLADSNLYGESKFTIGASTYEVYVNGILETRELDAPPYIDPAGRTMVSVKFAANSLGVSDQNIVWDQNSKTATIFKGDRVVVFKSGSNEVTVNGAVIKMDVACANNNGRLFVPIAHLANALGTTYEWDQDTQTVTLFNK